LEIPGPAGITGERYFGCLLWPFKGACTINAGRPFMAALSVDILFDAAIRIQLLERSITISFADNTIRVKFPTTRRLAEFLDVPHYYVLPYFAMMEQEELVTRAERIGILTTAKGSKKNDRADAG